MTNVLRHARAHATNVDALIRDGQLIVEISDDGVGFPPDRMFGRGLTGMQERVRALDGTLELLREGSRTCVRCRLPRRKRRDAGRARGLTGTIRIKPLASSPPSGAALETNRHCHLFPIAG